LVTAYEMLMHLSPYLITVLLFEVYQVNVKCVETMYTLVKRDIL